MHKTRLFSLGLCLLFLSAALPAFGETGAALTAPALENFRTRPASEYSKLLYLIDTFGNSETEILYEGHAYKARAVSPLVRWYIAKNYRKEKAEDWIKKWCHRSDKGERIWVRLEDGRLRAARDFLMEALDKLNGTLSSENCDQESP